MLLGVFLIYILAFYGVVFVMSKFQNQFLNDTNGVMFLFIFWPTVAILYGRKTYLYVRRIDLPLYILLWYFVLIEILSAVIAHFYCAGAYADNDLYHLAQQLLILLFYVNLIMFPISIGVAVISAKNTKKKCILDETSTDPAKSE